VWSLAEERFMVNHLAAFAALQFPFPAGIFA
jgi:hypothetical protein